MKIAFAELNMYEVENFHKKILSELKKNKKSFTLNFDNVENIDLNNIQLILALKKHCVANNITLKMSNIQSEQITNTFTMFGIFQELGIEVD